MGIIDFITSGLFGRRADDTEDEELVPGPMHTEELKPRHKTYGEFGNQDRVQSLRDRNIKEEEEAAQTPGPIQHDPGLVAAGDKLRGRISRGHLFDEKSASSAHKLERGIEAMESAETPRELQEAKRRFREKTLPKLERKADTYVAGELVDLQKEHEHELERLARKGASEHEIRRAQERYEDNARKISRNADRTLGKSLRRLSRRVGGNTPWRPKF